MGKTPKVAPLPIAEVSNTKDNTSLETLTEEMISDLETAFRLFDSDGSGTITAKELKQVFETLGQKPTDDELAAMLKEVDSDGSGAIDLEEFCQLMVTRMNDPDDPNLLKEAFKILDADNSGFITREELKVTVAEVMATTGEDVNDADIDDFINEFDGDGDGGIDYKEFIASMSHN